MNQIKILSPTFALDLTTAASSALQIVPSSPTRAYRVGLLNTGTGRAAVTFGTTSSNMETPVIASTGGSGSLVLPANMIYPMIIDCGAPDLYIKGISSGTNTLYITLVATE
jgi:hypothetical protein